MEFDHELFKKRLKEAAKGLSQKEISDRITATESTVSKWCNKTKPESIPRATDLLEIAREFGCSVDYLLGNDLPAKPAEAITATDFCKALVQMGKTIDMGIVVDNASQAPVYQSVCITLGFDTESHYAKCDDEFDVSMCMIDESEFVSIATFLKNYAKIRDTDLDADTMNTVIQSLLNSVDINSAQYIKANVDYRIEEWKECRNPYYGV